MITYDVASLNIGGAMDLASGVFTVPVNGRYQFNFVAMAGDAGTFVLLRLNGGQIARGFGPLQYDTVAITAIFLLNRGYRIDTVLWSGSINDCSNCYETQFTGILLEEDLVLS